MSVQVSVIMPVFNAEKYLKRSIRSILSQTFSDFELIIVNDGSSDNSMRIIDEHCSDTRVKVISRENRGLSASLNEGILRAKGKYIARMDADDCSFPKRLEEQVRFLESRCDVGICGTFIKIRGKRIRNIKRFPLTNESITNGIFFECPFAHPTVMWRRELFVQNGFFYREEFKAEDYELWSRILGKVGMANIPVVGLEYTVNTSGLSSVNSADIEQDNLYVQKRILSFFGINENEWKGKGNIAKNNPKELLKAEKMLMELYQKLPASYDKSWFFLKYYVEMYIEYYGCDFSIIKEKVHSLKLFSELNKYYINAYIIYKIYKTRASNK